mgnify:CR=1 FL=1
MVVVRGMRVVVAHFHEQLFDAEALSVSLPTSEGMITVLPHHEPFIATLKTGMITVRTKDGEQTFPIENGILEVSGNQAVVLL